jgi:hypothetical protein
MMLTDATPPNVIPEPKIPRWRIEAVVRAWEWSRRARIPYSPYIAVKAL